jgi:hypothetical protein
MATLKDLRCNRCSRPVPDLDSPEIVGWMLHEDGTALCPDCAGEATPEGGDA